MAESLVDNVPLQFRLNHYFAVYTQTNAGVVLRPLHTARKKVSGIRSQFRYDIHNETHDSFIVTSCRILRTDSTSQTGTIFNYL